ncbi:MAG: response regulator transcription factor [Gammaproteobacteria bacterium]|nr:response regulator transcription factor [Gammaproteobacteria bacterium]
MIRVLIVDDHGVVRAGFRRLINDQKDMCVVGEAESGEKSVLMFKEQRPDMVVMDLSMPGIGGLDAIRQILVKDRDAKILVLTAYTDIVWSRKVLHSGARGLLSKNCSPSTFLDALHAVAEGKPYIEQQIAQDLALDKAGNDSLDNLSEREFQIFRMLAEGHSSKQISSLLNLSPKTISTYKSHIFDKLDVGNVAGLTRLAIQKGVVEL